MSKQREGKSRTAVAAVGDQSYNGSALPSLSGPSHRPTTAQGPPIMPVRIDARAETGTHDIVVPSVPDCPRPRGVYLLPDFANPDRLVIEIWGYNGACLSVSTIQYERAGRFTEVLAQKWLDEMDPPVPVLTLVSA